MKKPLILLLTLTMILSLLFVSCDNNSKEPTENGTVQKEQTEEVAVEKTFTEENYAEILEKNRNLTNLDVFKNMSLDSLKEIKGTFKLSSKDGFSLLSEEDLKSLSGATEGEGANQTVANTTNDTTSGETEGSKPNVYEYIEVKVSYQVSASEEEAAQTENTESQSEGDSEQPLVITYKLLKSAEQTGTGESSGTQTKDPSIKLDDIMGGSSDDPLVKEILILISKAMKAGEGEESGATVDISFSEYLGQIVALGATTPEISLSVELKDQSDKAVKVALSDAKLGGNSENRTLTFGGTLSITKDNSNVVSLGSNISVTFSEDFDIEYKLKKGENNPPTLKGSVSFDVKDIKLALGTSVEISGDIKGSAKLSGGDEGIKATCNLTEKFDGNDYIVTSFNINYGKATTDFMDALTFTKFKFNGDTYSCDSVKAVLKKVMESEKKQA